MRLYWDVHSGHAHRVQLMLSLLGLSYSLVPVSLRQGEHKSAAFLAINPLGQLPAIEDGPIRLFDSLGILTYLALRYDRERRWLPEDPVAAAEVARFLGFAAGPLEFGCADARLHHVYGVRLDIDQAVAIAHKYCAILDAELETRAFLAGPAPTIADVANYSFLAHADEGGVNLGPYPAIMDWLERVAALPGFVPMARADMGPPPRLNRTAGRRRSLARKRAMGDRPDPSPRA
ncbi:MAG: glutathione S-transferase N-terminal domain-containing protein [Sphingomonas sp.]|nr:glutathione S-transferase N-terminal domain-containing protein [Sphingomonas sp.]